MNTWQRAALNGIELEYQRLSGCDPIVLVHAGVFRDSFLPLLQEAVLADRHCLVTYHRVGYAGSSRVPGPMSLAQQAAQLRALMEVIGIHRAHLVGHSAGGTIALQ